MKVMGDRRHAQDNKMHSKVTFFYLDLDKPNIYRMRWMNLQEQCINVKRNFLTVNVLNTDVIFHTHTHTTIGTEYHMIQILVLATICAIILLSDRAAKACFDIIKLLSVTGNSSQCHIIIILPVIK